MSAPPTGQQYWKMSLSQAVGKLQHTADQEQIRDIQGVLEHDSEKSEDLQPPLSSNGPDIVLDTNQSVTVMDACKSLPPRPMVNKLLSVYFNSMHSQTREHTAPITEPSADTSSDPSYREVS